MAGTQLLGGINGFKAMDLRSIFMACFCFLFLLMQRRSCTFQEIYLIISYIHIYYIYIYILFFFPKKHGAFL